MVVVTPGKDAYDRGPSTRGRTYTYIRKGQVIVAPWPRKRTKAEVDKVRGQMEWFRQANLLAKYAAAKEQAEAIRVTKGSAFYPRDLMLKCMAGRAWAVITAEGKVLYPVAAQQDVSRSLDVLGQVIGSLLYRGEQIWQELDPGTDGQVLAYDEANKRPMWIDAPSSGGSPTFTPITVDTASSSSHATKGWRLTPLQNIIVSAAMPNVDADAGDTFHVEIWSYDSGDLVSQLWQGPDHTPGSAHPARWLDTLDTPVTLEAGTEYVILLVRTDGSGTDPCRIRASDRTLVSLPVGLTTTAVYASTNAPTPGTSMTNDITHGWQAIALATTLA